MLGIHQPAKLGANTAQYARAKERDVGTLCPWRRFQIPSGYVELPDYRWHDNDVNHLFCKKCGVYLYHGDDKFGYRVNLSCVDGVDVFALDISILDGRSL